MRGLADGQGKDNARVGVALAVSDQAVWNFDWQLEKWSEEAVDFCRGKLERQGVDHLQDGFSNYLTGEKTWDNDSQSYVNRILRVPRLIPVKVGVTSEVLRKLVGEPEEVVEIHGNLLLNEGIQELEDLLIAAAGTTAYNNANADIGVGNSTTAAAATDTGLLGASTLFKGMVASYPQRTSQTVDWRSDFTSGEANFAWEEWSVRNGNTRNKNLNRKVQNLGTKATGTWTMTGSLTIS